MANPSGKAVLACIDSAGRLAAFLDIDQLDLLDLCATANVGLMNDTQLAAVAYQAMTNEPP